MTYTASWEIPLKAKAYAGLRREEPFDVAYLSENLPAISGELETAYRFCTEMTYEHSRTFYVASSLLPTMEKRAMRALYAFCRMSDDIVDTATVDPTPALRAWEQRAFQLNPPATDLIAVAWADARTRYQIPQSYGRQLLEGVSCDLTKNRYDTFAELASYCYGVASTVGLMAMHITGFNGQQAIPYAIKLGVALQLTNILRDVGEDWRIGRFYLPLEELQQFDLTEADIEAGIVDDRWRAFMRFQIERTRRLYEESLPGIAMLSRQGRFAVAAAAELYRAILLDIEANDYNNFTYRAHLSKRQKLSRLPGIYWRANVTGYQSDDSAEPQVIVATEC